MTIDEQRTRRYIGYTLVDITATGVTKYTPQKELERNQQRNWETVQQIVGLRSQIFSLTQTNFKANIKQHKFGSNYKGAHEIWQFEFTVEHENLYKVDSDPVGVLVQDFHQTPVVVGLGETAKFPMSLFYTAGADKNIYFISKEYK